MALPQINYVPSRINLADNIKILRVFLVGDNDN